MAETNDEEYLHHPGQHGVQAEEASRTLTSLFFPAVDHFSFP